MATYNIVTTAPQEALLTWMVQQWNLEHDSSLTNAQFVLARFVALLEPFLARYKLAQGDAVRTAFAAADPTTQASVKSLLGVT